ncbi:MAG: D-alanyl-D-alanine carboxypeptidase [Firmicutes bacterium]|jgi:D-alanyl-D-alanine carboxypeptidase (penicillin-binding protein 5/6)|nr:D-alanyl-D-alanine carboxypeptidase [Bacillota bacterium]MDH7495530.1 D-alanyl-D-alanine carboxypeptidase family protein [Bacillota bacterium]
MNARRVAAGVALAVFLITAVSMWNAGAPAGASAQEKQPGPAPSVPITAGSAILMEASSGRVLFEKDPDKRMAPASITKIMTMLLAMEAIEQGKASLDDMVPTSERAMEMGGSQIWLEVGEEMPLSDLMKAIAVVSANDASVAVAEHIAGSEEAFVDMMNERARELGMTGTHFANCHGLPHQDHYTTARDIAIMSRALLRYPKVHEWFTIWIDYVRGGKNILVNTNRLVKSYEGADGLKTGFTEAAGYCLAATAKRGGLRLIAVVLNVADSQLRFKEASSLLDFGFRYYSGVEIASKGQVMAQLDVARGVIEKVDVVARDHLVAVVRRGEEGKVRSEMVLPERITAPVQKGQKIGDLIALLEDGTEVARVDLVAAEEVKRGNVLRVVLRATRNLLRTLFRVGQD